MSNLEEHFEKQLERVNIWLSFAEAKNAALIAFNVAMPSIFVNVCSIYPVYCTVLLVMFILSAMICLFSFVPNLQNHPESLVTNKTPVNLLFFSDIAAFRDVNSYINQVRERYYPSVSSESINGILLDLASEILINSRIATRKYKLFKKGLFLDFFALIFAIIFLIIS